MNSLYLAGKQQFDSIEDTGLPVSVRAVEGLTEMRLPKSKSICLESFEARNFNSCYFPAHWLFKLLHQFIYIIYSCIFE